MQKQAVNGRMTCLIIDDDPTITDLIQHFCSKIDYIDYCISCNDPINGLKLLSNQNFDVLFLDYNMPDISGKAILEMINPELKVVMITSHTEFAVESYEYENLVDYLIKPIKFDRFFKSIERVKNTGHSIQSDQKEHYYVKDGSKWIKVNLHSEVLFIKSDSNYVRWQLENKQIVSLMKLIDLEKALPDNYIRIHRSYIINRNKIESLTKDEIVISGHSIPVGNNYKHTIEKILSAN